MASEKNFENQVKKWLRDMGIYAAGTSETQIEKSPVGWYFKTWGGGFQKSGLPDLIINANGFFVGCELKADNGRPSELQEKNIDLINRGNGLGIILYPKGFEDFKEIIRGLLRCSSHIAELNALKVAHTNSNCDMLIP